MDLELIGKFISEQRKEKGLTQEQFGQKIGVTNKTVSRWETGTYLPPADALLAMSKLFSVSINEILSGRKLSEGEYRQAAEENLAQAVRHSSFTLEEKIEYYKKKWLKEHVAAMVLGGICILAVLAAGFVFKNGLISGSAVVLLGLAHGWRNNAMMAYVERNAYDGERVK